VVNRLAVVVVVSAAAWACGSGKPRVADDARKPPPTPSADAAALDARAPASAATTGDVQVRVEWADVPTLARTSPGLTSCGTQRAPAVTPSTTWGIPDALVIVDGAPAVTSEARVRFSDCALTPRLVVAGSLAVDTTADRPVEIRIRHRYQANALRAAIEATQARVVRLPIAGHIAVAPLAPNEIVELVADVKDADPAWAVGGAGAVTDGSGTVLVKDVPVGTHTVRAFLPPRAGQPPRFAEGSVTVAPGDLAELTLALVP